MKHQRFPKLVLTRANRWRFGAVVCIATAGLVCVRGLDSRLAAARIEQYAEVLGRASIVHGSPVPDPAGAKVAMVRTTFTGEEVCVFDPATGKGTTVFALPDTDFDPNTTLVFGWSPSGSRLAFAADSQLMVCEAGGETAYVPASADQYDVRSLCWLSDSECATLDRDGRLILVSWTGVRARAIRTFNLPRTNGTPQELIRIADRVIGWRTDNGLWQLDLDSRRIACCYFDGWGQIRSLDFDPVSKCFLAVVRGRAGERRTELCRVLNIPWADGAQMQGRPLAEAGFIPTARWINSGRGFAYVRGTESGACLMLKADGLAPVRRLFESGYVYAVAPLGATEVLVHASMTNEPPGLWRIRLSNVDEPELIWAPWGTNRFAINIQRVIKGWAPFGSGRKAEFELLAPANFKPGRKYPLVLGPATYDWAHMPHAIWAQTLANAGAYVALVRHRWNHNRRESILEHTNHVLAVYDLMIAHPNVDCRRVYLVGFSPGGLVVRELARMYPERWRGVMLVNVAPFTPIENGAGTKVLVTDGGDPSTLRDELREYAKRLAANGVRLVTFAHPASAHFVRCQKSAIERAKVMARFVTED